MAINLNPTPTTGQGAYGLVPGQLNLPDPMADLLKVAPWLKGVTDQAGGVLQSQLAGQMSPDTINLLQDTAASRSAAAGMPGANAQAGSIPWAAFLKNLGQASENIQQQGMANYNSLIPTIFSTQTVNPNLQSEIAATNATTAAMPDPTQAAAAAEALVEKYMNPARGTVDFSNVPQFQPFAPIPQQASRGYLSDPYGAYADWYQNQMPNYSDWFNY